METVDPNSPLFLDQLNIQVAGPRTEGYLVVGTLDLNQGLSLPGEVMGERPTVRGLSPELRLLSGSTICSCVSPLLASAADEVAGLESFNLIGVDLDPNGLFHGQQ